MSYVEKSLGSDEEIKHIFKLHWFSTVSIYFFWIAATVFAAVFLTPGDEFYAGIVLCGFLGLPFVVYFHLRLINIEYAVTSKRVILKTGIIARKTREQLLVKVETVAVKQGILERIFGYGNVQITGTGASILIFKGIDMPLEAKKKIEELL